MPASQTISQTNAQSPSQVSSRPSPAAPGTGAFSSRAYVALLLPFVLSTVTQPLLGIVDTAVMGHMDNASYIAGVAVGAVIFNTMYWLLGFLRVGSTGFAAQAAATGDVAAIYKALLVPGLMALGLSVVLLALQGPIFWGAMQIMTLDAATREVTRTYYSLLVWGAPLVLCNYVILGWLMGFARIRATLVVQVGSNVLNMLLCLLFVPVLGMGPGGVALATLLAQAFALGTGLVCLKRALPALPQDKKARRQLVRQACALRDMVAMARVNGHLMLRTVCLLAQTNIFMATASTFGTTTLSANALILQILLLFSYLFEGMANASSVFAGRARATHDAGLLDAVYGATLRWTLGTGLVLACCFALGHTGCIGLFTDLPEVAARAADLWYWGAIFPLVAGPGLSVYGLFTGASVTRPVFFSTLLALLAFGLVWALAVPAVGNSGLWVAYLVFYLGRSLFLLPWMRELRRVCAGRNPGQAGSCNQEVL